MVVDSLPGDSKKEHQNMANPIIGGPGAFTRQHTPQQAYPQGYGQQQGQAYDPYQQQHQQPQAYNPYQQPVATGPVMTLDDVLAKTAITLGVVALAAVATFMVLPLALISPALIGSGLIGLVTVFMVSRRANVPVGGVLFYAAVEGVFIGAISKFFEAWFPGIVVSAVIATFVTAGATLAAYKFLNIRVTAKFRKIVTIATISLVGVLLVNFLLALFGVDTGMRGFGSQAGLLAIGVSIVAVVLAVLNLIMDFDSVERGIAAQAPASESWRAAFGITITMVWLYVEILRILSYFRD